MARILVSRQDHELLGATEFEIRDPVHNIGALNRSNPSQWEAFKASAA
jgi:hypothetical protein